MFNKGLVCFGLALLLACVGCGSNGSGSGGMPTPPAAPLASLSPTGGLTFASQNLNSASGVMSATLSNTGNASLSVSSITASGDFAETNSCPASVAAGASCTISVTFKPTAAGARNGTLTVNDDSAISSQTLGLTGTGAPIAAFFVAPNGKDSWSGTLAAPSSDGTDGPFLTFDHARATVQGLTKTGLSQIVVQFRAGTYSLASAVNFTAADSGTAAMPILYENYPSEMPVVSGGVRVTNWTNTNGNTWKTTLPASVSYFENLYYNGERRLRPRLNSTYLRVFSTVYLTSSAPNCTVQDTTQLPGPSWECFDRFQYDGANDPISSKWKNLSPPVSPPSPTCDASNGSTAPVGDIEVMIWEQFSTSKLRISCVDTTNHIVYLTGPTAISQANAGEVGFITGNRYIVENVQDQLTQPGQWFLDRSTSPFTLTYIANNGENPNTDTVVVPQAQQLLVATALQYVTFKGITFEHDNFTLPPTGHVSAELEPDIPGAVSFQNSSNITFDSDTVAQISGTGLEFIPCLNTAEAPGDCVANSNNINATVTDNLIQNSAFYDIGALGIRIGEGRLPVENDNNTPEFTTVQNNVVEGYGRVIPASFGIGQGAGHDNIYTHNDVYDGYHCAISISQSSPETVVPNGIGNANNVISFNHVWNLLQGIMNDGGAIRIEGGTQVFTGAGNKILNNKIHDVSDASIMDSNGYGGDGIYMDNQTGLVDVENNLVYRVSEYAVYTPMGPAAADEANTIKNNILAYARKAMVAVNWPYPLGFPPNPFQSFVVTNNLFYFDQSFASTPNFSVQGGCTFPGTTDGTLTGPLAPYTQYQQWNSNMYYRADGRFAAAPEAFHVQPVGLKTGNHAPCDDLPADWTPYTFKEWRTNFGEDTQSLVQDPLFSNVSNDDYSLAQSPGVGFVVFDTTLPGRSNAVINPPVVLPTFATQTFPLSAF